MRTLRALQLDQTRVTGRGFEHLHVLPKLWYLSLAGSPVSATTIPELAGITELSMLELQGTTLGDDAIGPFKQLAELPNLRRIDLRGTRISPAGLTELETHLQGCQVIGDRPPKPGAGAGT
jgi:hypothetical protein